MPLPADYCPVHDGLYVSYETLNTLEDVGPQWRFHDSKLIGDPLKSVKRWYRDLKRPGYNDAYCAVCAIGQRHDNSGALVSCNRERLFLVYFRVDAYGKVAFDWEWKPGNEKTGLLLGGDTNFGEQINGDPTWPQH